MDNNLIEVTFVRHGRSRADDEDVIEGRYDSPLTETGQAQARARGEIWQKAGQRFDVVICSTLQRAHSTAQILASCLGAPLEPDPVWMEMDNGPLAGLPLDVAEERYPSPAFYHPYLPTAGSGESENQLHCRAALAVEKVVRRGPGRYMVVSHGRILGAALRVITGAPAPVNRSGILFAFGDLGYASFTYAPSRHQWVMYELWQ